MIVEKLFLSRNFPIHMVVETEKGVYGKFLATPARKIREKDITGLHAFVPRGRNSEEAPAYMYKMYGLTKRGEGNERI